MLSTILIIDKRRELPAKYKKSLDSIGLTSILADNLKDGLVLTQNLEPDVIIISDSIDEPLHTFCKKIRSLTYNSRPVIIALSKSADTNDRIEVLQNGADDFLSEPVNIEEFKTRIAAHIRRDIESNLDNKTLLPNLNFVKKALKRALVANDKAILLISIENLKDYKSIYTELAGDKLIQTLVAIIKSSLDETDFLGQIDDTQFIIITNPYSAEKFSAFLTFAFDTVVPKFYSQKDAERGYTVLQGESYAEMRVNFVSILIGGILNGLDSITSIESLLDRLNSVKSLAKIPNGSNYAIERAKLSAKDSVVDFCINKKIYIKEKDESLNYLIRTALELQGYDVQDFINKDSGEQPTIIIVDSGDDLSELEFLKEIKNQKNFAKTKFIVTTSVHNKSKILDSGADLYLPKPYEISDLIKWVEFFIKNIT